MLEPKERRQLQDALISSAITLQKLKWFSNYCFEENLETFANCSDLSSATYDLIEWARSTGKLEKLINVAWENYSTNPNLRKFMEEVWKPLQPEQEQAVPLQQELEGRLTEAQSLVEEPVESQGEPIDINTKRHLKSTDKRDTEQIIQGTEMSQPLSPLVFPLNATTELRSCVNAARDSVQNIYNMFLPDKDVFHDQCQFAIKQVQEADESIGKNLTENIHTLSIHAPARSLLELEQTYFCEEAKKTVVFLQEFVNQTSSLLLRKKIWEKVQILMKSLQESDGFIDTLLAGIREDKVDS